MKNDYVKRYTCTSAFYSLNIQNSCGTNENTKHDDALCVYILYFIRAIEINFSAICRPENTRLNNIILYYYTSSAYCVKTIKYARTRFLASN